MGRTKDTFFRVIKVIIPICAIFWLLSYTVDGMAENTILYKIGNAIEPVTKVFGLNWKHTNIGVISFAIGFSLMMALDVALG